MHRLHRPHAVREFEQLVSQGIPAAVVFRPHSEASYIADANKQPREPSIVWEDLIPESDVPF